MPFKELAPHALHRASNSQIYTTIQLPLMPFRELELHTLHRPNIHNYIASTHALASCDKVSSFSQHKRSMS